MTYPNDWFVRRDADGFDPTRPGLYVWEVEGTGRYVGRYTHLSRPLKEYSRNVHRLRTGVPYHMAKPDGFRRIHRALAAAVDEGRAVTLHLVENCDREELSDRERRMIADLRPELNGRGVT